MLSRKSSRKEKPVLLKNVQKLTITILGRLQFLSKQERLAENFPEDIFPDINKAFYTY